MAFGGNTRDLGLFGEETDKITDLREVSWKNGTQALGKGSGFLRRGLGVQKASGFL